MLKQFLLLLACLAWLEVSASPANTRRQSLADIREENIREISGYFEAKRSELKIVKTTTHPSGQLVDWISRDSQGAIAKAPPLSLAKGGTQGGKVTPFSKTDTEKDVPLAELELEGAERGPEGTVPIARQDLKLITGNITLAQRMLKSPPPGLAKRQTNFAKSHWYATVSQIVTNIGGQGVFSLFKAFVQNSNDFSLIQLGVGRTNVPSPANPAIKILQTVEAGWINFPSQISQPHLFTYFTTNGYTQFGDYLSGYNRDVKGWVQVDNVLFPGTVFSPLSTDGGTQYAIKLQYLLYQGNWWLFVRDRWIGYYPASLFSNNEADASVTLAANSDFVSFFGEVYQTETALTTTDMGSGMFPATGWTHSAYIHNIRYASTGVGATDVDLNPGSTRTSDINRYRFEPHMLSGGSWGSYMWLGGPGAGGVVNG